MEDVERKSTCLGGYVLLLARLTYSSSRFFKSNKRMCPRTIVFLRLAAVGYHSDTSAAWPDIFLLGPLDVWDPESVISVYNANVI